jgi:quinol monooxygenase YgiN
MIISHGKFLIRENQIDNAKEAMQKMAEHSVKEPGCISYDYFFSLSNPRVVMLFQEWESIEAINQHFNTRHMSDFLAVLPELIDGEIISHRYAIKHPLDAQTQAELEYEFGDDGVTVH